MVDRGWGTTRPIRSEAGRFWEKVDTSGGPDACWPWTGAKDKSGYGNFSTKVDGKFYMDKAHRVAWRLHHGRPPPTGLCTLHNCPNGDNPLCCNPGHLWVGTRRQNNADRAAKGRSNRPRGETNPSRKLTEQAVRDIRLRCFVGGESQTTVAAAFGVTTQAVGLVLSRKTWKHVE